MYRRTLKINSNSTLKIVSNNQQHVEKIVSEAGRLLNKKCCQPLAPTDRELAIIIGLVESYRLSIKEFLNLDHPTADLNYIHVIDQQEIYEKTQTRYRGLCVNFRAYTARQDNLGDFTIIAAHELAHLLSYGQIIWLISQNADEILPSLKAIWNSGIARCQKNKQNFPLYEGLNEAITEKLAHYTVRYALQKKLITLSEDELAQVCLLSHPKGVLLLDQLITRQNQRLGNDNNENILVNKLFTAYLLGDIDRVLNLLGLSKAEKKLISVMQANKEDFITVSQLLELEL